MPSATNRNKAAPTRRYSLPIIRSHLPPRPAPPDHSPRRADEQGIICRMGNPRLTESFDHRSGRCPPPAGAPQARSGQRPRRARVYSDGTLLARCRPAPAQASRRIPWPCRPAPPRAPTPRLPSRASSRATCSTARTSFARSADARARHTDHAHATDDRSIRLIPWKCRILRRFPMYHPHPGDPDHD